MHEGRHRARPQGPGRPRGERPGCVRGGRRAGEGRAADLNRREAFEHQARSFAGRSPLYERLARELADDPLVAALLGDEVERRAPLQLLGGLHYLVLSGRAAWDDPRAALRDERAFLSDWLASQAVQTNEVRRCRLLLPCFLEVARRTGAEAFDCVELGCSAGLNLLWDRYGYDYANGSRGPSNSLVLAGEKRGRVPAALLALRPQVRSRVGVDLAPPDLRGDDGVRLLQAFVWPGQDDRLGRLERAVEIWRADPPPILVGDLVDELPALLERRRGDALLLLWETAAFGYLPAERREQAFALLDAAGESGPLAFVRTGRPQDGSNDHYGLVVQIWPGGERVELGYGDFHGAYLDWRA